MKLSRNLWYMAGSEALRKNLVLTAARAECQPWPIVKEITSFSPESGECISLAFVQQRQAQVLSILNFLGSDMKKMWLPWNKWIGHLLVFLEIWKTNRTKSGIISRQRLSQERGPGPPFYPGHPSALASCPLNWSHCLTLMQTLAPLWFCREAAPLAPLPPAWGFFGLIPLSCDSGCQPGGPLSRVVLEICADLLHKNYQVNPFGIPWEMSSQGQSLGSPCLNPGLRVRMDGGQDLWGCLDGP